MAIKIMHAFKQEKFTHTQIYIFTHMHTCTCTHTTTTTNNNLLIQLHIPSQNIFNILDKSRLAIGSEFRPTFVI